MSDITKCKGENCPLKETCERYLAPINKYWQSYFTKIPYNFENKTCNMYWKNKKYL